MTETSLSQITDVGTWICCFCLRWVAFFLWVRQTQLTRHNTPLVMIFEHAVSIIFYILIKESAWMSTWGKKGHVLIAKNY